MIKIWAKLYVDNKINKDMIYKTFSVYSREDFFEHMQEICYLLDISVPVILPDHFKNFERFRLMKFLPRDFIDSVSFDYMILENITEE